MAVFPAVHHACGRPSLEGREVSAWPSVRVRGSGQCSQVRLLPVTPRLQSQLMDVGVTGAVNHARRLAAIERCDIGEGSEVSIRAARLIRQISPLPLLSRLETQLVDMVILSAVDDAADG